ncbi:MAG: hypothetical protein ACTSVI_06675 [Promethearchaeota archaeon]
MIIINVKSPGDFSKFLLNNRVSNHVFYEIRVDKNDTCARRALYLSFLGTLGSITALFQYRVTVPTKVSVEEFIDALRKDIGFEGIDYVEATIREIFISIS